MGKSAFTTTFHGYSDLPESDIDKLWNVGLVILDTNVLLGLYRTSDGTRDTLLDTLDGIRDRLWMPNHVGVEFHNMRQAVIKERLAEPVKVADEVRTLVSKALTRAKQAADANHLVDPDGSLQRALKQASDELTKNIGSSKDSLTGLSAQTDIVLDRLTDLYSSPKSVGKAFSQKQLSAARKKASDRFEASQPPGYADNGKQGDLRYGDVFIWFQTLAQCKKHNVGAIFVTNDEKKDWRSEGNIRPELRQEFQRETVNPVIILHPDTFVREAHKRGLVSKQLNVESASTELENYSTELASQARSITEQSSLAIGATLMRSLVPLFNSQILSLGLGGVPGALSLLTSIDWGALAEESPASISAAEVDQDAPEPPDDGSPPDDSSNPNKTDVTE